MVTKTKHVLIVDDDPVHLKLIEKVLMKYDYQVSTCNEAAEGLQFAIHNHPDLIILDVMMPVINGYNFCQLLKNEEKQKHIPIIMVTARDEKEDEQIGLDSGADAYLTKPINPDDLLETIKQIRSRNRQPSS